MIKTENNLENDPWKTIKAKNITTSPTLVTYLRQTQWNIMDGHPKQIPTCQKFQKLLLNNPYSVFFKFNETTRQLKLMTPSIKPNTWEIIVLRFPNTLKRVFSAEIPRLKPIIKGLANPQPKSDCSGSLKNYASSEDVLTEFEIEETPAMVRKWIKNKWIIPHNARAIILLDSSSDSDTSETEKLSARRLQYWQRPPPEQSSRFPQTDCVECKEGFEGYVPAFGGQNRFQAGVSTFNHMYHDPDVPPRSSFQWLNHHFPGDMEDDPSGEPHSQNPPTPNMSRPVPKRAGKYDLFCDDSTSDQDSDYADIFENLFRL